MKYRFSPLQYVDLSGVHPDVQYREYSPSPALAGFVACYWSVVSSRPLTDVPHRVVTDACMDIICDFSARQGFMAGIADSTELLRLNGNVYSFGIRFLPHCIPYLLKHNAAEGLNAALPGEDSDPLLREMIQRILDLETPDVPAACCRLAEQYLAVFFSEFRIQDRFGSLLGQMLASRGGITVGELSDCHRLSEKQIGRCVKAHLGMTPKSFLRILRFQHTLSLIKQRGIYSSSAELAAEAGYYDQSHLLKDLHVFLGDVRNIY